MLFSRFAAAYPREDLRRWYADDARHAVTADAAVWAHLLGERLHDYLTGVHPSNSTFAAHREMVAYSRWNQEQFVPTVRAIERLGGGEHGVRKLHLHTLAHCTLSMWRPILGAGPSPNVRERRESQVMLATHAAHMIVKRRENAALDIDPERAAAILAVQHGMLTETDTLITLIELARHRSDLIVLPAPPQFEAAVPGRNVDLLVLDLDARTVAGIQVKTAIPTADKIFRTNRELVLVDGATDLGNQRLMPLHPRTASKAIVSWPGLISAHFVLRVNPRTPAFSRHRESVIQLQRELPDTTFGTTDYLERAVAHLERRVFDALAEP